jgi:hypothetical protein
VCDDLWLLLMKALELEEGAGEAAPLLAPKRSKRRPTPTSKEALLSVAAVACGSQHAKGPIMKAGAAGDAPKLLVLTKQYEDELRNNQVGEPAEHRRSSSRRTSYVPVTLRWDLT